MKSLLGQFYTKIKGSQEDIASEGLAYILQRSENARYAINAIIKQECEFEFSELNFVTQNNGTNLERPDISGYDKNGKERLIIEAKFWASLTDNQPNEYLKRLESNSVLMFVCPNQRLNSLKAELINRTKIQPDKNNRFNIEQKFIIVKTWNELLDLIKTRLIQEKNETLLSDLQQIIGFCHIIDDTAFLPLQSKDLSPEIPRRINKFTDFVDKVVDELRSKNKFNTDGLKATPQRWGYRRYGRYSGLGLSFDLGLDYWASRADTPFWLSIKIEDKNQQDKWFVSQELINICKKIAFENNYVLEFNRDNVPYFGIFPLINQLEDNVVKDLTKNVERIVDLVANNVNN